jgi:hypothetical protein
MVDKICKICQYNQYGDKGLYPCSATLYPTCEWRIKQYKPCTCGAVFPDECICCEIRKHE